MTISIRPLVRCEDSNQHDLHCRLGHYSVSGKNFYLKTNALIEASKIKQMPQWHFHDSIFADAVKKHSHFIGLENLYRLRAQQLRDTYDYLILSYSGGSDSDTILKTFLNNNIKLDEVWHDTPLKFIEKSNYVLSLSKENTNYPSEYFMVVLPELQELSRSGKTKVHFSDSCAEPTPEDFESSQSFYTVPIFYNVIKRYRYIHDYMQSLPYQRVALIVGIDKVIPWYHNGSYGFQFIDNATFCRVPNSEYFFWTPDMPEIAVEQAKTVWNYLLANKKLAATKIFQYKKDNMHYLNRTGFDYINKKICYPTWDHSKHQVNKYGVFTAEHVKSLNYIFSNEYFFQTWHSNYRELVSKFDPLFACENQVNFDNDIKKFFIPHKLGEIDWNS